MGHSEEQRSRLRVLLLMLAAMYGVAAVLYNEFLLEFLVGVQVLDVVTEVRWTQVAFAALGLTLGALSEFAVRRLPRLSSKVAGGRVAKVFLGCLPVLVCLSILESSLDPFASTRRDLTTVFVKDEALGWKLRPNADDLWGGVRVSINGKGLRGPELEYDKPQGVRRILYLGDSVTFGYKLQSHAESFPYITSGLLEASLGCEVQTINAGVGGYSPWQEYVYLSTEGIKYDPDLIILSFVLNDVVEKLWLTRFGGPGVSWQMYNIVSGAAERFFESSSIVYFARKLDARRRFGRDVQRGAIRHELVRVRQLVNQPERPSVRSAWRTTFESLDRIFSYAQDQGIPLVVVCFPFVYQLANVEERSAPQRLLGGHASERDVPMLDLLPLLVRRAREDVRRPREYFLDADHLSPVGNEVVAEILAEFVQQGGFLAP